MRIASMKKVKARSLKMVILKKKDVVIVVVIKGVSKIKTIGYYFLLTNDLLALV